MFVNKEQKKKKNLGIKSVFMTEDYQTLFFVVFDCLFKLFSDCLLLSRSNRSSWGNMFFLSICIDHRTFVHLQYRTFFSVIIQKIWIRHSSSCSKVAVSVLSTFTGEGCRPHNSFIVLAILFFFLKLLHTRHTYTLSLRLASSLSLFFLVRLRH